MAKVREEGRGRAAAAVGFAVHHSGSKLVQRLKEAELVVGWYTLQATGGRCLASFLAARFRRFRDSVHAALGRPDAAR